MAVLNIVKDDNNILAIKCNKANYKTAGQVIKDLRDTAKAHSDECYGLSANQIGYSVRIIAIRKGIKDEFQIMLNPRIINHSTSTQTQIEYCLSLPARNITRWNTIDVLYETPSGILRKERFVGLKAAIIQHEIDHLNGKII